MNYWLIKSEADCYSIEDLKKDKVTAWTGVRNYQARNFMRDSMQSGDLVLYYHSSAEPTGVYGVAQVASKAYPDPTQFKRGKGGEAMEYFDPKATTDKPIWYLVDMAYVETFTHPVSLTEIKIDPKLEGMVVRQKGSRLSIQPVSEKHFKYIRGVLARSK
jgi:predicted RNA-binding protein with PUA-like domain